MSDDPFRQFALSLPNFPNAACNTMHVDPDTWFSENVRSIPERNQLTEQAVAICQVCPHMVECLQYAVDNNINDGIFGGSLPDERKRNADKQKWINKRQKKMDDIRILLSRGWTTERACEDVGLTVKVFERYKYLERAGWPY